jgi:predicted oxidoreductase
VYLWPNLSIFKISIEIELNCLKLKLKRGYITMSKTTLSPIISGVMNWGIWDKKLNTKEMENIIHLCLENKISTFDHADIYGDYTTEADSKEYIIESVENSLKNLATDYLDVLLLHRPSPLMQADEIAEAVAQLKADGKIIDFGLSNFTSTQTELIRQKTEVSFNQIQFSASHHEAMLDGSLDYMQIHSIRPMSWNPLGNVFRTDNEQTRRMKILLAKLVAKYGVGSDTILLAWILQHPAKVIPIAGTVNVARIQALMKATQLPLEKEDWFAIWSESMGKNVP